MKKQSQNHQLKAARIEAVVESQSAKRGSLTCVLNHDLRIEPEIVCSLCFQPWQRIIADLTHLVGVIAFADRIVTRTPSQAWGREIEISMPMIEPDRWNEPRVLKSLIRALDLVTGDCWDFEFHGYPPTQEPHQDPIPFKFPRPIVIPYSNGLDSYAVRATLEKKNPEDHFMLVTVGRVKHCHHQNNELAGSHLHIYVPFELSDNDQRQLDLLAGDD